jgi:hypothetical protein
MAKPGDLSKGPHRCGARLRSRQGWCRKWPVPGRARCRLHGGASTGAVTAEGRARANAAREAGRQRWLQEMRAKKATGEIKRFPCGRRSGPGWITPRMWATRQLAAAEARRAEAQAAREALQPPPPPPRRRGRPTLLAQVQAQIVKAFVQLPEQSPLLAGLHGRLGQRVAEARRELERRGRSRRPDF